MIKINVRKPTASEGRAIIEYASRQNMSVSLFRPQVHQDPFFLNWARQRVLRGGTRAGKSLCAGEAFAAKAMDIDITLEDGTVVPGRQPWQKGRCLIMWVIGYDSRHIGETIYRILFKNDMFKIIKDEVTGRYRTYRDWVPEDKAREGENRPAAPLIPKRYIKPGSWDWENKKNNEFKRVTIIDPVTKKELAHIYAYSSKADAKAGDPVDMIWIDEHIDNAKHYAEWRSRLADKRGDLIWSSWPSTQNDALMKLSREAAKEASKAKPLVREIVIAASANKALSDEARQEAYDMITSEEERRSRDRGEYVTDLLRMYPLFDQFIHQAVQEGDPDEVSKILRQRNGVPPADWTIELVLDPGSAHPGILFGAIPPSYITGPGRAFVIYDELSPERHDATQLAEKLVKKLGGRKPHRFIIDWNAGRQKSMGHEITVEQNYLKAFKAAHVKLDGSDLIFTKGSNNVGGRIGVVQEWTHLDPERGLPTLRIVREKCPMLCQQLFDYKKACSQKDVIEERPADGQQIDLAVALEYWAASSPAYVVPKFNRLNNDPSGGWLWFQETVLKKQKSTKRESIQLGPQYN